MKIREATGDDVGAMAAMLESLVMAGRRTMPADSDTSESTASAIRWAYAAA